MAERRERIESYSSIKERTRKKGLQGPTKLILTILVIVALFAAVVVVAAIWWNQLHKKNSIKLGMDIYPKSSAGTPQLQFSPGYTSTFDKYTENIQKYIDERVYNTSKDILVNCASYNSTDHRDECGLSVEILQSQCTRYEFYGYHEGQPCILLTFHKDQAWTPTPMEKAACVKNRLKCRPRHLPITCEGVTPLDRRHTGKFKIFPEGGFPSNQSPPVAFVQMTNPTMDVYIEVECKMWVGNPPDDDYHRGFLKTRFSIQVNIFP